MGLIGKLNNGEEVNTNDLPSREFIIKFFKEKFDIELISNKKEGRIDLLSKDGSGYDVEIELTQALGDYCSKENFNWNHFLRNAYPNSPHMTVNISERKFHYWISGEHLFPNSGNIWYNEVNHLKNKFVRHNKEQTQVIIVYPEVINDESKIIRSIKNASNIRSTDGAEKWISIKMEYCEIWNKVNNEWILDTKKYD